MKEIEFKEKGLEDIPYEEVNYYGPKIIACTSLRKVEINNFIFELYRYDIKSNGTIVIKIFYSNEYQIFEELKISYRYNWKSTIYLNIKNNVSKNSNAYFELNAKLELTPKDILKRLALVCDKIKYIKKRNISYQYLYAYIIFLFYSNNEDSISVKTISEKYNTIKTAKILVSYKLDNFLTKWFSSDTIEYKVFDRFVGREIEKIKSQRIRYD